MSLARAISTGDLTQLPSRRDEDWKWTDLRGLIRVLPAPSPVSDDQPPPGPFAGLADAVESAGGYYSNFTGDGLMALFGLETARDQGALAALKCALSMFEAVDDLKERLAGELETPLAIGIGIHTGEAIVGRMGPPKTPIISALGDSVNTTARLESTTKELGVPLVVSADTLRAAAVTVPMPLKEVSLRGRSTTMAVAALDAKTLRQLLSSAPAKRTEDKEPHVSDNGKRDRI